MDPVRNPFAPNAGSQPPELAGRKEVLKKAEIMLQRLAQNRSVKCLVLDGLRGVGKTVLLNRMRQLAETNKVRAVMFEASENRNLPEQLIPPLRRLLLDLDRGHAATDIVKRGMRALGSFAKSMHVKFEGVEVGFKPEHGVADSGDLENDLTELCVLVAEAAKVRGTAVALLIDELQYIDEAQLGALLTALHKANQMNLPLSMLAAGLPQLVAKLGKAKSYSERLIDRVEIGPLDDADATAAIAEPIHKEGEKIEPTAVKMIVAASQGYPYFLQTWGKFAWDEARQSPISKRDVDASKARVTHDLDESFFRIRLDRMTPSERNYLRAMAELGAGPHRSGDIATALGVKVNSVAPFRSSLIKKGMIYSREHGETAFTVPMFDQFMKRQFPKFERRH
jgi:hypothetical protein